MDSRQFKRGVCNVLLPGQAGGGGGGEQPTGETIWINERHNEINKYQ